MSKARRHACAASLVAAVLLAASCGKRGTETLPAGVRLEPMQCPAPAGCAEPFLSAAGGRVHLSWLGRDGERVTLNYATWLRGAWSPVRTVVTSPEILANWADLPSVVPMIDGTMVAHWLQRRAGSAHAYDVRLARSIDGTVWSNPRTPHADTTATEHGFVSIVPNPLGGGLCVWLDGREYAGKEEGAPGVQTQLRSADLLPGGELGAETVLDPRV